MSKVLAYGTIKAGGSTVIEWPRSAPQVIDTVAVGDNMRVSLMQDDSGVYVALSERIPCSSIEQARRVFNGIVGDEAERRDVTAGGSGESIELEEIPF